MAMNLEHSQITNHLPVHKTIQSACSNAVFVRILIIVVIKIAVFAGDRRPILFALRINIPAVVILKENEKRDCMKRDLAGFAGVNLTGCLETDRALFSRIFEKDAVFRERPLVLRYKGVAGCLLFFDGMVNAEIINEGVIKPLTISSADRGDEPLADCVARRILCANEVKIVTDVKEMLTGLLYGDSVLLLDGSVGALVINTKGWRTRGISEPGDERVQQGPREGFDEALMFNVAMLRRKLPTPDLCIEGRSIGRKSDTKIFICYLESVVRKETVELIRKRLDSIDIDGILDSHYINELISDHRWSLFKTMGSTERPDIVAARLLEGRVAIMVDGTPVVLTMPYLFAENFQSDDDYYTHYLVAGIGRVLRYLCFYLAVCLPALYLAVTVFHPALLPTSFFISIAAARNGVPFSSFAEILLLILVFEILKETGIRMQQSVGNAMSIVGGLVVGQAAVEARLVSAPVLIITALCGIAGLMLPRLKGAIFYLRLMLLVLASLLGLFGFFLGFTLWHIHLYALHSFEVGYVEPGLRFTPQSLKDTLIRSPWNRMILRPFSLSRNRVRQRRKR